MAGRTVAQGASTGVAIGPVHGDLPFHIGHWSAESPLSAISDVVRSTRGRLDISVSMQASTGVVDRDGMFPEPLGEIQHVSRRTLAQCVENGDI
ncbi:hypothetical protein [Saliphagus infecundisoli]|uniref:Uncharacterized protein n=1 Tax=Saliphagus infecundisoli TaxID=1849069 RepID=A0ABD5QJG5_9EURY|nr:hypothetical protein [Saliphagus infecundisoli]